MHTKMLMKLKTWVNFVNILRMRFLYQSELSSVSLVTFWLWNFWQQNFVQKKHENKMLMKLTPAINFINILRARFSYKFFAKAKTYLEKAAEMMFVQKILT